ncbi:MAG: hypothetical protein WKG07_29070 [Hymenobacter sp.]
MSHGSPAAAQTVIPLQRRGPRLPAANNTAGPTRDGARHRHQRQPSWARTVSTIRYIQDGHGWHWGVHAAARGPLRATDARWCPATASMVTGGLKMFRGLLEIDPIVSLTVLAGNRLRACAGGVHGRQRRFGLRRAV